MQIAGRPIDSKHPPFVIGEISCNHCGDMDKALQLIKAAKDAGADSVKFQAYEADDLTIEHYSPEFQIQAGPWAGRYLHELYTKAQTPFRWFPWLFEQGKRHEITVFASVFSKRGVDMLEKLDCPAYKIASMEIVDIPLIQYAASTGKPLIISTGMATQDDINWACHAAHAGPFALLHCISGYPSPIEEANLGRLKKWIEGTETPVGISDHTLGISVPVAATALGAMIIEKHFMLFGTHPEDEQFSLTCHEFEYMVGKVHAMWQAMQPSEAKSEESSRQLRRSLYVVKDVKANEPFTEENVRSIRPAYGMASKELPRVLSSFAASDISRGSALEEGMLLPF